MTPEKDHLQNLPAEVCANWYQNFDENRNIRIKNLEDIRESEKKCGKRRIYVP
ncbi:MAG: hypothetical protein ACI4AA_02665 [Lachnospiraceae bacterium]